MSVIFNHIKARNIINISNHKEYKIVICYKGSHIEMTWKKVKYFISSSTSFLLRTQTCIMQ